MELYSFFLQVIKALLMQKACIIGIPGGYIIGTSLKNAGMSTGFVFPLVSFSVFVIVMVLIETLLTVWLIRSWKKQSIIEIIRN